MRKEKDYERTRELVYDLMCGHMKEGQYGMPIENEFREGSFCDCLYSEIYDAVARINERLGTDSDTEIIQDRYAQLLRYLCYRMYDHGYDSMDHCCTTKKLTIS